LFVGQITFYEKIDITIVFVVDIFEFIVHDGVWRSSEDEEKDVQKAHQCRQVKNSGKEMKVCPWDNS